MTEKKFVQSVAGSTNTEVKVTRAILQKETTFKFTKNVGMQMAQTQNSLPDCQQLAEISPIFAIMSTHAADCEKLNRQTALASPSSASLGSFDKRWLHYIGA